MVLSLFRFLLSTTTFLIKWYRNAINHFAMKMVVKENQVFEAFYRVPRDKDVEGTGLGLHVPLSEDGGGVATLLELLGPRRAFGIQGSAEIYDAILVTVQSGHHGRS